MHTITVNLDDETAEALAQFLKRIGWSETRQNASGDAEAHRMSDALHLLRKSLYEAGFDPR